jgi:hypothetical protein
MGGAVGSIKKVFDKPRQDGGLGTVADQMREGSKPVAKSISSEIDEERAARRRARRGGRALLSEQRLTPEAGVGQSTLGAGPMA